MLNDQTPRPTPSDPGEPSDPTDPLLVTIPQAAKILSVGRSTIYQLIWSGELTPIHIGRCVRLSVRQVHEWIDRQVGDVDGRPVSSIDRAAPRNGPGSGGSPIGTPRPMF